MKETEMEITEVRVKLVQKSRERLRAFCSITFDGAFVVRDLKVIGGGNGGDVFVAMPSRKLCDRCPRCRAKNHLRARFCNECGQKLVEQRVSRDSHGRAKIHADVAHPINTECREMIQNAVIKAYEEEIERSKSPDYKPPRFDEADEALLDDAEMMETEETPAAASAPEPEVAADTLDEMQEDARVSESAFSDYDSLIAELKQEAATRDDRRRDRPWSRDKKTALPAPEPVLQESHIPAGISPSEKGRGEPRRDRPQSASRPPGGQQRPGFPKPPPAQRQEQPAAAAIAPAKPMIEPAEPRLDQTSGINPAPVPQDEDPFGAGLD
jgi:stage V sporulation protein G